MHVFTTHAHCVFHTERCKCMCIAAVCAQMSSTRTSPQEGVLGTFPRCFACQRSEVPSRPLFFTTLAQGGQVFLVCQHCFLCIQIRELGTGGDIPNDTLEEVRACLLRIYELLRLELADVYGPQQDGGDRQG